MYIYQQHNWPAFKWDNDLILPLLTQVRYMQGKLVGKMGILGFELRNEAVFETLTLNVIKTSEIEGEILNLDQVRSSIARRLGIEIPGFIYPDRHVEGIVEMMIDATQNYNKPLTSERLFDWHCAIFPTGKSGMYKISVRKWRDDSNGPMQVVSGAFGKEKVHYQAPDAALLKSEMGQFLKWYNKDQVQDYVIKAAIAHLWFITLHPFEDGNGRIARALTDMLLAKSDNIAQRFYSMSAQIRVERKQYYEVIERTQKGSLDITEWIKWFLNCLKNSLISAEQILATILNKHQFWSKNAKQIFNDRQVLLLNKLLDGFTGKLNTSKWAKIAKCSADTALRDINDLINKNILQKDLAGGRSTNYELIDEYKAQSM